MIRVVLVDDQAVVRAGFRVILESSGGIEVVGEAADGPRAVEVVAQARPDVVLMDIRMPGGDGIEATRAITALGPDGSPGSTTAPPAVLVVTTFDLDDYVFGALEAGASGFVLKDAEPEELIDAVRALAEGRGLLSSSITRRVITEFAHRLPVQRRPAPATGCRPSCGSTAASTTAGRHVPEAGTRTLGCAPCCTIPWRRERRASAA